MKKQVVLGVMSALLASCSLAVASPLVTSNVPLDSRFYDYVEKLEGMGYINDMPASTKPYSRLDMAKWLANVHPSVSAEKGQSTEKSIYGRMSKAWRSMSATPFCLPRKVFLQTEQRKRP